MDAGLKPRGAAEASPRRGPHSIWRAFGFSRAGLAQAFLSERAFRLELLLLAFGVPLAFVLADDVFRRAALIAALVFVLAVELLNTCMEKLCDRIDASPDPAIKAIKDMGSAAVFCALCACALLWSGALWARLA
jgi:diacylglycerol kinase (ATP)